VGMPIEVNMQPFVIRRVFGVDDKGRKFIRHERAGSLVDAREAKTVALVDPVVLAIVRAAGPVGIGKRDLRAAVNERLRDQRGSGVRNGKVDESADRLQLAGEIVRPGDL
jgi:hypothetical protein